MSHNTNSNYATAWAAAAAASNRVFISFWFSFHLARRSVTIAFQSLCYRGTIISFREVSLRFPSFFVSFLPPRFLLCGGKPKLHRAASSLEVHRRVSRRREERTKIKCYELRCWTSLPGGLLVKVTATRDRKTSCSASGDGVKVTTMKTMFTPRGLNSFRFALQGHS